MDVNICFHLPGSPPVNTCHFESRLRPAAENPAADLTAPLDTHVERNSLSMTENNHSCHPRPVTENGGSNSANLTFRQTTKASDSVGLDRHA
jgi:hypothetical protein